MADSSNRTRTLLLAGLLVVLAIGAFVALTRDDPVDLARIQECTGELVVPPHEIVESAAAA